MRRVLAFVTSRYGLAGLAALAVIVVVLVGRLLGMGGGSSDSTSGAVASGADNTGSAASGAPNDGPTGAPSPVDPVVKPGQPGPLEVATDFAHAFLDIDVPVGDWRKAMSRYATPKLVKQIKIMDPDTMPLKRLTGKATLGDHGAVWADVKIPADQGTLVFQVLSEPSGWQVDGIDWDKP
jgi:hypothetical protein